jgi:hypothetical protein
MTPEAAKAAGAILVSKEASLLTGNHISATIEI